MRKTYDYWVETEWKSGGCHLLTGAYGNKSYPHCSYYPSPAARVVRSDGKVIEEHSGNSSVLPVEREREVRCDA